MRKNLLITAALFSCASAVSGIVELNTDPSDQNDGGIFGVSVLFALLIAYGFVDAMFKKNRLYGILSLPLALLFLYLSWKFAVVFILFTMVCGVALFFLSVYENYNKRR